MKLFNKMLDRMKFLQIEKLCFQQAEEILGNRWPCEKFSVNSPTVIKNDVVERLEKQPLLFLQYTITTVICQVSSAVSMSGYIISNFPKTLPQFLSGIVHFLAISWVAKYKAFKSAVSLGNTLLCLFRRR